MATDSGAHREHRLSACGECCSFVYSMVSIATKVLERDKTPLPSEQDAKDGVGELSPLLHNGRAKGHTPLDRSSLSGTAMSANKAQLESVTEVTGDRVVRRAAATRVKATESTAAQVLLSVVDENGGMLDASQAATALQRKGLDWKKVIDNAGGLKKFCMQQRGLEFVTEAGNRTLIKRSVQRLSATPSPQALLHLSQLQTVTPSTSSGASSASGASAISDKSEDDPVASAGGKTFARPLSNGVNLGNPRTMYHATSLSSAEGIIRSRNFKPGSLGVYGPGIYFCKDPEMAKRRSQPKSKGDLVVLEFQVQLGRLQLCPRRKRDQKTRETLLAAGYHSIKEEALLHDSYTCDCYMIPHNGLAQIDMKSVHIFHPEVPLPPGWRSAPDPNSGRHYYWQDADPAGTTTWQRPA